MSQSAVHPCAQLRWSESFFNRRYLAMFMTRSPQALAHDAHSLKRLLGLQPGMTVADFCCGTGDVLAQLRCDGIAGCGVELSAEYVDSAHEHQRGFVTQGDALRHDFGCRFDAVFNWYSSFGYLGQAEDRQLLANMVRHALPGAPVLVETYNAYHVLQNFQPEFVYERDWEGQHYVVRRLSTLDLDTRSLHQKWTFDAEGQSQSYETASRLYFVDEVVALMREAGLTQVKAFETPSPEQLCLRPLGPTSRRVCVVGRLPGA